MADILGDVNVASAIDNLAKSIEKSNTKILAALQKVTNVKTTSEQAAPIMDEEAVLRKKGKVFKEVTNVNIAEFSKTALDQLTKTLKGIIPLPEKQKQQDKKPEDSSFLKKLLALAPLLLPLAALALKFLAGLSGDKLFEFLANLFPKLFNIKKIAEVLFKAVAKLGDYISDAFKLLKETKLGKFFTQIGDDIAKFFKPITNFLKENKILKTIFGESGILQKVFGDGGFFSKMFGKGSVFAKIFDTAGDATKILTGGVFGKLFKGIGKSVLKKLPILGSIFSFYDAYNEISSGDYLSGFTSLFSGIANLIPGLGTVISIGLDLVNFLFKSDTMEAFKGDLNKGLFTQAFSKLGDVIGEKIPFLKWFNNLAEYIGGSLSGDQESIINLFSQFGLGNFIKWMYGTPTQQQEMLESSSGINGILINFSQKITETINWFLEKIPGSVQELLTGAYEKAKAKIKGLIGLGGDDYDAKKTQSELEEKLERKKREKLEKEQNNQAIQQQEMLNDFIAKNENVVKKGDTVRKFSQDDTVVGFKKGGELDKTVKTIINHLQNLTNNGNEYVNLAKEQVKALQTLIDKANSNVITSNVNNNSYILNPSSSVRSFRAEAIS